MLGPRSASGPWPQRAFALFAASLEALAAAAFYGPALDATHGDFPAPLDDVFIHYDFARSIATLHPFEWIAGQGYSSGETSPLYAWLLALGYAAGFRGLSLGVWAAGLACTALLVLITSLRELIAPAPAWVSGLGAAMIVSVGVLDWTWFSGMEGAVSCCVLARLLVAARRAREAPPQRRRGAQLRAGALGAALVLLRPEAFVVVGLVAVVVGRRALSQSAAAALLRTAGPAALVGLMELAANLRFTGEAASAGAIAKLLTFRPFLHDVDRATVFVENLVRFALLVGGQLGRGSWLACLLPILCAPGLVARRTRALALVCLAGAIGWGLLVSWNDAARFQNFRYYVPALTLVLIASTLGLSVLAQTRRQAIGALGAGVACVGIASAASSLPGQIAFFRDACANIHDQQVEVGRRLATLVPEGESILVGDAGAIPYVSQRHAVDALGLGGFDGLPFARAALAGQAATVELIERIPPRRRPRAMALYASWFGDLVGAFGREVDHVSLEQNVICGDLTKTLYEADWSALAGDPADDPPPSAAIAFDVLDVADVVSEREHEYLSPAPVGGWTSFAVRPDERGAARFDAGRAVPEGQAESFTLLRDAPSPAALLVRTDGADADVEVRVVRRERPVEATRLTRDAGAPERWAASRASFSGELLRGDRIELACARGTFRDFHVWVVSTP